MHDPLRGPTAAATRGEPFLPRRKRFSSGIDGFAEVSWRASKACAPMPARGTRWLAGRRNAAAIRAKNGHGRKPPRCGAAGEEDRHAGDPLISPGVAGSGVGNIRLEACMHVLASADKLADAAPERRGS